MPSTSLDPRGLPSPELGRTRGWLRANPMVLDSILMMVLAPVTLLGTMVFASHAVEIAPDSSGVLLGLLLGVLFTAPLLLRRTQPDLMTGIVAVGHVLQLLLIGSPVPGNIVAPIFLYSVARYGRQQRTHRWWLALALAGSLLAGPRWAWHLFESGDVFLTVVFIFVCAAATIAAWALAQWARQRELAVASLRDRAAAVQRQQQQSVQLVVEEERNRIAREMHDVIAHSLSVIVVQSDGARYLAQHGGTEDLETRLAHVGAAIDTINQTARAALGETRRLVGNLRAEGGAAQYEPSATLVQVEGLVAKVRDAGVKAAYSVSGDPHSHPPLGSGAELAAYRVIQESLTNALKHAGPGARVIVHLHHSSLGLDLLVRDDGVGARPTDGRGHGIIGMRERVTAWGGSLAAGPLPGGGWQVHANIPATKES